MNAKVYAQRNVSTDIICAISMMHLLSPHLNFETCAIGARELMKTQGKLLMNVKVLPEESDVTEYDMVIKNSDDSLMGEKITVHFTDLPYALIVWKYIIPMVTDTIGDRKLEALAYAYALGWLSATGQTQLKKCKVPVVHEFSEQQSKVVDKVINDAKAYYFARLRTKKDYSRSDIMLERLMAAEDKNSL